ncbi:MAG: hypothetical protein VB857_00820 [Pirellulaceae bacterium]|jgi:hypothetical protein
MMGTWILKGQLATGLVILMTSSLLAQGGPRHFQHSILDPPGTVGRSQLLRGGPVVGYYQPVEFKALDGMQVSVAKDGKFQSAAPVVKAGLLIGQVYRLRVSKIPFQAGREVYPSVEIINRLYPPQGLAWKFPIPIHLTSRDMEFALQGRYITRVIYLENPRAAVPAVATANIQPYFDVGTTEDPLHIADQLGRPMAILRLGSRVPRLDRTTNSFLFNSPPVQLPGAATVKQTTFQPNPAIIRNSRVPRLYTFPAPPLQR